MDTLLVTTNPETGQVASVNLYGHELLDAERPSGAELLVNGRPLRTRLYPGTPGENTFEGCVTRLKGEQFTDHFSGWGLVVTRNMGERSYAKNPVYGIQYHLRRDQASMKDLPCPGPGGPVIEAPLFVDTFSLLNWNWNFWGEDTRMVFPSLHSTGPIDEFGHAGYEHDSPEKVKTYLQNVWRRIYPGVMAIHGGLFYNPKTEHWLAITCRRPNVGYILNLESAGRAVSYDFTLHAPFDLGQSLTMPEIKLYWGQTSEEMWRWAGDYIGSHYQEPPAWFHKTVWGHGLAWTNKPSWTEQAEAWEKQIADGQGSGLGYSLVTNRPVKSGTTPLGYEPDPNHGSKEEFRAMGRRMADAGVPFLTWMSYSGLMPGGDEIDDDWFVRGIDGRLCAAWGNEDQPSISHINPGHPGYIEYTKKWIRFYMKECGAKGIFMDCLGWAFPPDYKPRSFMRFPGDTNRMGVRFLEEIYACIKECDPDGILLGEGTTLEGPINVFSINSNPARGVDGLGPRDFLLWLNQYSTKRLCIDQSMPYNPSAGLISLDTRPGSEQRNRALTELVAEHGGRKAFLPLPKDLSILLSQKLLVVPAPQDTGGWSEEQSEAWVYPDFQLPAPWHEATTLTDTITGRVFRRGEDAVWTNLKTGIYRIT